MKFLNVVLALVLLAVSNSVVADPWIQFSSNRDGERFSEFVMNPDGSNPVNVSEELDLRGAFPIWSPDGMRIAFEKNRPGDFEVVNRNIILGPREIWVMHADGSNRVNLTNHDDDDVLPRWSPDGTKIAFQSKRNGEWEIFVMNADGSDSRRLGVGGRAKWSPDGSKILFDVARPDPWQHDPFIMNDDGSGRRKLADLPNLTTTSVSWSPDGTRVMLHGIVDDNWLMKIYVVNVDGSDLTDITKNLTPAKGFTNILPGPWSPDGRRIVFSTLVNDWGRGGPVNSDIFVINTDGTNLVNLTNHPKTDIQPSWSPDGSKIVFTSVRDGNYDIFTMDADGSNPINLTNHPADDANPSWLSFNLNVQTTVFTPEGKLVTTWGQLKRDNR